MVWVLGLYGRTGSVILTAQFHFISIQRISAPDLLTGIFRMTEVVPPSEIQIHRLLPPVIQVLMDRNTPWIRLLFTRVVSMGCQQNGNQSYGQADFVMIGSFLPSGWGSVQIDDDTGVEDVVGIKGAADAAHDLDLPGGVLHGHELLAGPAGAVLGGDGAAVFHGGFVDLQADLFKPDGFLTVFFHDEIMDAAVADGLTQGSVV